MDSQTPSAPHLKSFLYSFSLLAIPYTTHLTSWFRGTPTYGQNQLFMTGLVVLLYNVCYLTLSPGFEIPLVQAGDGLSNLWVEPLLLVLLVQSGEMEHLEKELEDEREWNKGDIPHLGLLEKHYKEREKEVKAAAKEAAKDTTE
ncbi:hypothetical protein EV424DRAFT_1541975 [Suillus variegatus]|nr:hypothetical protein EV424DRAFT_1541975 [Suillus variegatus]